MKKMRKKYVVPLITKHLVELEEGVCATGSFVKDTAKVEASSHEHGEDLNYNNGGFDDMIEEWK